MCLLNFQFHEHPNYKLILVANRDEAYDRPTAAAHFWEDEPFILAGRDLRKFGTWLGITKTGRFAALTNAHSSATASMASQPKPRSRGTIVQHYLTTEMPPETFLHDLRKQRSLFDGFNLLVGDSETLMHYNSRLDQLIPLSPGAHGLSNATLDTPWPKVVEGNRRLAQYVKQSATLSPTVLLDLFGKPADTANSQKTNTNQETDTLFISSSLYGTVSSTALFIDNNDFVTFAERRYNQTEQIEENQFQFQITP